jgi:hypothetical protein
MAQKTYKQIQEEADRLFGKKASDKKFAWRQSQQKAAGLAEEKRKRGGVAGTYDRNKNVIRPAAELAAGYFGGPVAASLVGAGFRGFDRPGKGGIGFDAKQGALGALEGYGLGSLATGLKAGFKAPANEFAEKFKESLNKNIPISDAAKFAKENAAWLGPAATSAANIYGAQSEQAIEEERLRMEQERIDEDQARRDRLAQLLMPMFQQQTRRYGGQG